MSAPPVVFSPRAAWRLRLEQNRSRRDVAAATRISQCQLKFIERGLAQPSIGSLTRLATALGVEIGELFEAES